MSTPKETLAQKTRNNSQVWFDFCGTSWSPKWSDLSDQELRDLDAGDIVGSNPDEVRVVAQHLLEVAERYARYCAYLYERRERLQT